MSGRLIDDRSGSVFEVRQGLNTIGRREENDICLPSMAVSRYHCEIRSQEGNWSLEDQGSTYGTYVNGQKVEGAVPLKDGDSIIVGVTSLAPDGAFRLTFRAAKEAGAPGKAAPGEALKRSKIEAGRWVIEPRESLLVVRMGGVFRRSETDELLAQLRTELHDVMRPVALDLSKASYMNSYTLSALLDLAASLKEKGKVLSAFGSTGSVRKLLMLPGEANPIRICESEDEALNAK